MEIELRNVWHSYDGFTYALKDINLNFKKPGLYIVVGPNGAGKTTLLKIVSLILKPSQGFVLVNNKDFWKLKEDEKTVIRRDIVFVHDKPILLRGTVKYNIEIGLTIRNAYNTATLNYYVNKYGLEEILNRSSHKLSAGQAKIVSIVRALVLNPYVLILDEPFTFLDETRQNLLLEEIKNRVKENKITIVATHYMYKELVETSNNIIEIISGKIRYSI